MRRLRHLGSSYQEIADEFLAKRARELLANDEITIEQVVAALAFYNSANFSKTFKRWHGVSAGNSRSGRL